MPATTKRYSVQSWSEADGEQLVDVRVYGRLDPLEAEELAAELRRHVDALDSERRSREWAALDRRKGVA